MPVVGVASKLRQPTTTRPVHTALPIPSAVRRELGTGQGSVQLSSFAGLLSGKPEKVKPERSGAGAAFVEGRRKGETEEGRICKVSVERELQVDADMWERAVVIHLHLESSGVS
uniref:Uncharacterized protein n=1 Tax=Knipowitschia caucasica TaxID=637954 RepID=A0AAV2IWC2_KNICA